MFFEEIFLEKTRSNFIAEIYLERLGTVNMSINVNLFDKKIKYY